MTGGRTVYENDKIYMDLAEGEKVCMHLSQANRHGLIASGIRIADDHGLKILDMKDLRTS